MKNQNAIKTAKTFIAKHIPAISFNEATNRFEGKVRPNGWDMPQALEALHSDFSAGSELIGGSNFDSDGNIEITLR